MTIAKNKFLTGALALALIAAIGVFPAVPAHAASLNPVDPYAGVEYETIQTPADTDMAEYVKSLTMLTESEKQQLVEESIAAQPIIDRRADLDEQIDSITNDILLGAEKLFAERGQIMDKDQALWAKLWDYANDEQKKLDDYSAIIKASTALTDAEKDVLLRSQARLDVLNADIGGFYEKAAEATAELTAQRDQAIAELQELYAKSAHIWAKVYGE